jgi:DinB superfamily
MDTIECIRQFIEAARHQTEASMKDTTVDQFNWTPPGTASPISAVFIHLLVSEDYFFQAVIQGKPKLWEGGYWGKKTRVKNTPDYGGNWEEFKQMTLALEPVLAYQRAVYAATDAYLEKLTPEELERKVQFAGGEHRAADMIIHTTWHSLLHAGEIAVLKGIQGFKGLPY